MAKNRYLKITKVNGIRITALMKERLLDLTEHTFENDIWSDSECALISAGLVRVREEDNFLRPTELGLEYAKTFKAEKEAARTARNKASRERNELMSSLGMKRGRNGSWE